MYIKIFGKNNVSKGVNISNLGKNGDDLLIKIVSTYKSQPNTLKFSSEYRKEDIDSFIPKIVINLKVYNLDSFENGIAKSGRIIGVPDRIISSERFDNVNEVVALKYMKTHLENLGLEEYADFKLLAENTWNDEGLDMYKRVTMPDDIVINNSEYVSLITKVKSLLSLKYAVLNKVDNLNIMYFRQILPNDYLLIKDDENILIENK